MLVPIGNKIKNNLRDSQPQGAFEKVDQSLGDSPILLHHSELQRVDFEAVRLVFANGGLLGQGAFGIRIVEAEIVADFESEGTVEAAVVARFVADSGEAGVGALGVEVLLNHAREVEARAH